MTEVPKCKKCNIPHEDTDWFMGYDDDNQEYQMWVCGNPKCQNQWWVRNK